VSFSQVHIHLQMANNIISSKNNLFFRLLLHVPMHQRTHITHSMTCVHVRHMVKMMKALKQVVLRGDNIISHLKMFVHLTERHMYA